MWQKKSKAFISFQLHVKSAHNLSFYEYFSKHIEGVLAKNDFVVNGKVGKNKKKVTKKVKGGSSKKQQPPDGPVTESSSKKAVEEQSTVWSRLTQQSSPTETTTENNQTDTVQEKNVEVKRNYQLRVAADEWSNKCSYHCRVEKCLFDTNIAQVFYKYAHI